MVSMNDKLFRYAKTLIKRLEYTGSTDLKEFYEFKFGDGSVMPMAIITTEIGTYIKCTCKHCSIHEDKSEVGRPYLCSYKLALTLKKGGLR